MTGKVVKNELERILKKVAIPWSVVLYQNCSGGTENVQEKFLVQPVLEPRYEPETSGVRCRNILHTEKRCFCCPNGL